MLISLTLPAVAAETSAPVPVAISKQALIAMKHAGNDPIGPADSRAARPAPASAAIALPSHLFSNDIHRLRQPLLKPGIMLNVMVVGGGRKEISEDRKRVDDDGTISLPLIGVVRVEGMTLQELSVQLRALYAKFLHNPQVEASFCVDATLGSISPWGAVTVLGRVRQPGSINIPPTRDLTVSKAIQSAGGLDSSANDSAIQISRQNEDGTIKKVKVDLPTIGTTGNSKNDITLQAGDVVFVPETIF